MKKILRLLALIVFAGAVGLWLATGTNRGWSKTSVPVKTLDEITGIEGITYQKRFVPGLDFLGAAGLGAGVLAATSLMIRRKPNHN